MSKRKKQNKFLNGIAEIGLTDKAEKPMLQKAPVLFVGSLGGAALGAVMGKPSLYSGLATVAVGWLAKSPIVSSIGVGMTLSGCYKVVQGINGTGLEGPKERFKAFVQDFKERLYIDEMFKPKTEVPAIEGMGNVQYFRYPALQGSEDLDFSALDKIQRQIEQSAENFQNSQTNDMLGIADPSTAEERIY